MPKKYTDGAFALVFKDDKFLLTNTHFKAGDFWSIPGGVVEPNETPQEGAIREVFEETGITCTISSQIKVISKEITKDLQLTFFMAHYVDGEIKIDATEIESADWFSVDQLDGLDFAYSNTLETINLALTLLQ